MSYIPRNNTGRSQANDPIAPKDIANKQYVDAAPPYNDPASNQLSDFSFDNWNGTTFTQWTTFWKTGTVTSINQVTGAGTNAVDTNAFQVTFGAASSIQRVGGTVVAVTPGQYFQFSIWAKGTGTSPTVEIDCLYNTSSTTVDFFQTGVQNATVLAATNLTTTWTLYSGYFMIPSGYTYARMYITTGGGSGATVSLDRATMRIAVATTPFNGVPAGGAASSLLVKNSATDYDYTWGAAGTAPTASTYMLRDASGNSQVGTPSNSSDIANKAYVDAVQATDTIGATITGSTTVAANTFYTINLASGLGLVGITLPATPANGTVVKFVRIDANNSTSTATITRGGSSDLIQQASFTSLTYVIAMTSAVTTFSYLSGFWYVDASVSGLSTVQAADTSATPYAVMIRDTNGNSQVGTPSSSSDIANKQYVDSVGTSSTPPGSIQMYVGIATPSGWAFCNGTALSRTNSSYTNLLAAITFSGTATANNTATISGVASNQTPYAYVGSDIEINTVTYIVLSKTSTTITFTAPVPITGSITFQAFPYGNGDGSTTFNLPDFTNSFPMGNAPGVSGGATTHTHTAGSFAAPSHTHSFNDGGHTHTFNDGGHTHSTPNHIHNLSSNGQAEISLGSGNIYVHEVGGGFTATNKLSGAGSVTTDSTTTGVSVILNGNTDSGGASTTGTGTANGTTGSGTASGTTGAPSATALSGTSASGSSLPPYVGVHYMVKL